MSVKMKSRAWAVGAVLIAAQSTLGLVNVSAAEAAGKPRPKPSDPSTPGTPAKPVLTQPDPVHAVFLLEVGTQAFHLPNGSKVELNADLPQMLETAVSGTSNFRVIAPQGPLLERAVQDPCVPHLELKAAITSLDLKVAGMAIKFGFSPTGETATVTNLTGKVQVDVGLLAMDFSVRSCLRGECQTAASTYTTQLLTDVGGSIEVDFDQIKTGTDFLKKTALGKVIRKSMDAGMQKLSVSPYLYRLPWNAIVTHADPATGEITIDRGRESNIYSQQSFAVYQEIGAMGVCPAHRSIAYVHTDRVDLGTSTAVVDESFEGASIKAGDTVRVRLLK